MSWLRAAWNYATYRTPAQNPTLWDWGLPGFSFAGWSLAAEFGPTVYTRHPELAKMLARLGIHVSPAELRQLAATLAAQDALREVTGSRRVAATQGV